MSDELPAAIAENVARHQAALARVRSVLVTQLKVALPPEHIELDAPLFGTGLGLDSIDALELVVLLEKEYGIVIKDIEEGRPAFRSVRTLADFIAVKRPQ